LHNHFGSPNQTWIGLGFNIYWIQSKSKTIQFKPMQHDMISRSKLGLDQAFPIHAFVSYPMLRINFKQFMRYHSIYGFLMCGFKVF
jgi:hypothetical protein